MSKSFMFSSFFKSNRRDFFIVMKDSPCAHLYLDSSIKDEIYFNKEYFELISRLLSRKSYPVYDSLADARSTPVGRDMLSLVFQVTLKENDVAFLQNNRASLGTVCFEDIVGVYINLPASRYRYVRRPTEKQDKSEIIFSSG